MDEQESVVDQTLELIEREFRKLIGSDEENIAKQIKTD